MQQSIQTGHRKTHTKSRKGCTECKRRHIKCSESKPRCTNCTRLNLECIWPKTTAVSPASQAERTASSGNSPNQVSIHQRNGFSSDNGSLAIDDLRLLHHWTIHTSQTLGTTTSKLWQDRLVEVGFQYHFLLHGILALSAIHKATTVATGRPDEKESLMMQSSAHMNIALGEFRALLHTIDPNTSSPVFALSSLLVVHRLAVGQVEEPSDPITELHHCMHLVKGVKVVLTPYFFAILATELAPLIANGTPREATGRVPEVLRLKELVEAAVEDETRRSVYFEALERLHDTFLQIQGPDPEQSARALLFVWPASLPDAFLAFLADRDPVALVFVAYFAMLFRLVGDHWWLRDWDKRLLNAIQPFLEERYKEWLVWPMNHGIDSTA